GRTRCRPGDIAVEQRRQDVVSRTREAAISDRHRAASCVFPSRTPFGMSAPAAAPTPAPTATPMGPPGTPRPAPISVVAAMRVPLELAHPARSTAARAIAAGLLNSVVGD